MKLVCASLMLLLAQSALAQSPTPDEQARFLAGLPQEGSSLFDLAQRPEFRTHAKELDSSWADAEARQFKHIREWAPSHLPEAVNDSSPLLYVFSGPDFLHAQTFFPNASTYILCGVEPVGTPPDVTKLNPGELPSSLWNLRNSLNASLSFSFFITADMRKDFSTQATKLNGTLPVLYVFLARGGCHITSVENIWLDPNGAVITDKQTKTSGARIQFIGPQGKPQTVYYFSTNIANWALKQDASFLRFCDTQGQMHCFTKSASYLMHLSEFSTIRDYILKNCRTMTQDDSGIPWGAFPQDTWNVWAFGWYPGPIKLFEKHYQPDLAAVYKHNDVPPIPFGIGYQWRAGQSTLIYGVSKTTIRKALPVADDAPPSPEAVAKPEAPVTQPR